ncbi:hypothetical protein [Streptomyces solicathayae]|uniref:Uncharacterized protein n=1 Tax=Streptomyces solicathayae TaxID=3081768 RepID=A0ABZ0LW72_9ACTN|nr:hypothetical protein [Streptomyces sp. HUAS YS2]WOX23755.1 hypothetical protein R2D22_21145 [Streptomyces sp. HUAS YS2]
MTQSGQGPEPHPAVRPTHEGVVLPAEGGVQGAPGGGPTGGQPWGGAWGPGAGQPPAPAMPPVAQPLPPEAVPGGAADMQATQYIAPVPGGTPGAMPPQGGYGYPGPGAGAPAQPQGGYGYPGPGAPGPVADMQATQHIPPVQAHDGDSTQFLGTGPLRHGAGPGAVPAGGADAEATQYIAPIPAQPQGERTQPPAEFDNLFRSDSTQQLPQMPPQHQQPQYGQQPPQQPPYGGYQQDDRDYGYDPEPRRKPPVAAIAAVVIGCAVLGLGAGAVLSGGDDDKDTGKNVAASSSAPTGQQPSPAKGEDPAETQAKALDKLLADSNNSRDAVIRSVGNIRQCKSLDEAASDLRGAAEQRRGLVTRLQTLTVDQLPKNGELTAALTKAWQASASADDHYAAWADQMKGKKACKGGHARRTAQTAAADAKSGEATTAKREAAGLWNPTADKYGLTKRQPTQL